MYLHIHFISIDIKYVFAQLLSWSKYMFCLAAVQMQNFILNDSNKYVYSSYVRLKRGFPKFQNSQYQ
jgi:hypothetical protein